MWMVSGLHSLTCSSTKWRTCRDTEPIPRSHTDIRDVRRYRYVDIYISQNLAKHFPSLSPHPPHTPHEHTFTHKHKPVMAFLHSFTYRCLSHRYSYFTQKYFHTVSHTATFQSQVDLRKTTFTRENKKGQVEIT